MTTGARLNGLAFLPSLLGDATYCRASEEGEARCSGTASRVASLQLLEPDLPPVLVNLTRAEPVVVGLAHEPLERHTV